MLSEPDRGVYDAWNKGIDRAEGDFVSILNSDDVYAPGAFKSCAKIVSDSPSVLVVSGGCQIYQTGSLGNEVEMHRYQDPRRYRLSLRNATVGLPIISKPVSNGVHCSISYTDSTGRFDLAYSVASDREFLIRASLAGIADVCTSEIYYRYLWHPGSLTMNAGNRSMLRSLEDGLEMIRRTRASGSIGSADGETLQEWQRELHAKMVLLHAVMRDGDKALAMAKESVLNDPRWLLTFLLAVRSVGDWPPLVGRDSEVGGKKG